MNTHVFIVNEQTFKYHLEYMFAGTGAGDKKSPFLYNASVSFNANSERNLVGMIADISRIQIGDNIIFYLQATSGKQGQFFGVFTAKSKAFFDENNSDNYLKAELGKGLSYRILIEASDYGVYRKGITEHEYLDSLESKNHPYELCWSLIYRKLKGNRGCTMITDFEFNDLLSKLKSKSKRLSFTDNYTYDFSLGEISDNTNIRVYNGKQNSLSIENRLLYKANRNNAFETHLQAYILQNIRSIGLLDYTEKEFWIGNEVSCGVGMQRIDILIKQETNDKICFKVVELKDEQPTANIVDYQLSWYTKWLFDYIIPNYSEKTVEITPCIVAAKTDNKGLLKHITEKEFRSPYSYSSVNSTEYYAFNISEDRIDINKIL